MSDVAFNREPIFWTTPKRGYNDVDRQRIRFQNGKPVMERFPQRGHLGDYENRLPAPGIRFWTVVRHDGHSVFLPVTNAAAHLDIMTSWAQYQRGKMAYYGWFLLGACPLALRATGELHEDHFACREILADSPCQQGTYSTERPCPHCVAEKNARMMIHRDAELERMKGYQDPTERIMEANAANAATIADQVAQAFAKLLSNDQIEKRINEAVAKRVAEAKPPSNDDIEKRINEAIAKRVAEITAEARRSAELASEKKK